MRTQQAHCSSATTKNISCAPPTEHPVCFFVPSCALFLTKVNLLRLFAECGGSSSRTSVTLPVGPPVYSALKNTEANQSPAALLSSLLTLHGHSVTHRFATIYCSYQREATRLRLLSLGCLLSFTQGDPAAAKGRGRRMLLSKGGGRGGALEAGGGGGGVREEGSLQEERVTQGQRGDKYYCEEGFRARRPL